ncbi:hypothetical protein ACKFKG_32175 [Phormidesmis sp. 146-35]
MPKRLRGITLGLVVSTMGVFQTGIATVQAETTMQPVQQTVVGTRSLVESITGMRGSTETRTVLLETTTPLKQLELMPLDLYRADGAAVFPASAISLGEPSGKPNELILPLQFDLGKAPSSGEFSGSLRLSNREGQQSIPIPVTVRVKDPWLLPLLMLLAGTGLGMGVSAYRAKGKPRDEILVRAGQLRSQMQDDRELEQAEAFRTRLESGLVDIRMALQGERWEEGQAAIAQAELLWSKWLKGRSDWLVQLQYAKTLKERLQDQNPNIPYIQLVSREVEDALRELPDLEGPNQLRDRLDALAQQINRFFQFQGKITQLNGLVTQLLPEQAVLWQPKVRTWEQQIESLQPSDSTESSRLQTEMDDAIASLSQLIAQQSPAEAVSKGMLKGAAVPYLAPAPSARSLTLEEQGSRAGKRLRLFIGVSYAIALLFLTGAGFRQLYVDNPTFGANPWKDYFALLAWGFGSEASREAITKLIQGRRLEEMN